MNPNQSIVDSGWKFVIAVSGGGQGVLGDLTKHGGMSDVLLEGIVPYSTGAYHDLVRGRPDHIASSESARAAAMVCYKRARRLAPGHEKVFGAASTAALAKIGPERGGRQHKVFIALQDAQRTMVASIAYEPRRREVEELLTAYCIDVALRWGCHIFADMRPFLDVHHGDRFELSHTVAARDEYEVVHGLVEKTPDVTPKAVFPSSCNPLHDGHLAILKHAEGRFPRLGDIAIELCVENMDKPPLDYMSIQERLRQVNTFVGGRYPVVLTNKPLFFDKAKLFPGATFLVGSDTYDRIMDPRYYPGGASQIGAGIIDMHHAGNEFLVYPRKGHAWGGLARGPSVREMLCYLVTDVVEDFDGLELSSSALRELDHA